MTQNQQQTQDYEAQGSDDIDVTILMPCLNEIKVLPYCIDICQQTLNELHAKYGLTGEVLVSDNGSTDGSVEIAQKLGVRVVHCVDKGYGNALCYGIKNAKGRIIVMGDADGSYDFHESIAMVEKLEQGFDLCMGSRFKGRIMEGAMPWKNRYIGNPILTGVLNVFFKSGLSDAHCGLRAFTRQAIDKINPSSTGMEFASEIVIKASLLGLDRTEVPITLHPDKRESEPHLRPWRDGWRHLRYLIMLSPLWLFFIPALLFAGIGIALFLILLSSEPGEIVRIGMFSIGTHWAVIAGGCLTISHLSFLLGMSASIIAIQGGYRKPGKSLKKLYRLGQLESMLLTGFIFIVFSATVFVYVIYVWSENNYGGLDRIREIVLANTLFIIGIQNIYSGFLLANILGNKSNMKNILRSY